jgi:hypothetical protein
LKTLIVSALVLILMLTACGSEQVISPLLDADEALTTLPLDEVVDEPEEDEALTTPPPDGGTPPTEGWQAEPDGVVDEPEADEPFNGIKCVEEFVKLNTGWYFRGILPHFEDINEVELRELLSFGFSKLNLPYTYYAYTRGLNSDLFWNGDENWAGIIDNAYGFKPSEIDKHFKEYLSFNFSIERFDYKISDERFWAAHRNLVWCDEKEQIIMFSRTFGGGPRFDNVILDVYEENGFHYVITRNFKCLGYCDYCSCVFDDEFELMEFSIYTFIINENGNVNIISKLPYEGELP